MGSASSTRFWLAVLFPVRATPSNAEPPGVHVTSDAGHCIFSFAGNYLPYLSLAS